MRRKRVWQWAFAALTLCIAIQLAAGIACAMDEKNLGELVERLEKAPFKREKLVILQAAAEGNTFTCEQVVRILKTFDFATDQIDALRAVAHRIENPEEKEKVIETFVFLSDREKAREILQNVKPVSSTEPAATPSGAVNGEFAALIQKMEKESFGNRKLLILEEGLARLPLIPSDQVGPILKCFDFDADRLKAVRVLERRVWNLQCRELLAVLEMFRSSADRLEVLRQLSDSLSDAENKFILFDAFPYLSERTEAKRILEGVQFAHPLFGPLKAKRILFIIDASGSMTNPADSAAADRVDRPAGESKFQYLQREMTLALREYLPGDASFNMIFCTSQFQTFTSGLAKVTSGNVEKAITYLQQTKAADGMPFIDILTRIMNFSDVDAIYFITDGMISPTERTALERMIPEMQRWYQKKKIDFYPVVLLRGGEARELKEFASSYFRQLANVTSGIAYIREE